MADSRYLEQRRQGWYCVVEIPPSLRAAVGRKRLRKSLGTRSLTTAQARRWPVLAALKAQIANASAEKAGDPIVSEAMAWREAIEAARRGEEPKGLADHEDPEDFVRDLISERSEQLRALDTAAAKLFDGLATGAATPLSLHLETWLAEGGQHGAFKERTKGDHRRAVKELGEWLAKAQLPATLEAVDRRAAGRFMSEHLHQSGRAAKTITKIASSLSTYWWWLRRKARVPFERPNPWLEQAPAKRAGGGDEEKERPFKDAEVVALLNGSATPILHDFMRVAALSGMRREEIGRLKVADCCGGMFVIRAGKTAASRRRVPIHSVLAGIVERRTAGKSPGDYLFHDLTSNRAERTDALGKQFQRYRETLGIKDGTGRRSLVNFHSWRRWADTAAINAGQPPHVVSVVMGHIEGRQGMTLGRYWGGPDDAALRGVIESIRLPE